MKPLNEYLRDQAYWAIQLAEALERGESIENMKWASDLPIDWQEEMAKMHGQQELNAEINEEIERRSA